MFCSRCGTEATASTRFCPTCGLDLSSITGAGQGQGATSRMAAAPAPEQDETAMVREALKDEYELEKELGRGGMAVVYKGRDKQLEREVAIKVLPFSLSFDAEFVERFQREARTAGKLEHPNIIPIYRVGKSGRVIYFVMKFIRGKSLSSVIETRGALPVPESKRFLIESARALGYAHKHGIVHRDIKPDNIMFDELGQAIVADFGIAKAQSGAKLTGTGMSIGTPHYMSPEQARAQNLDGRSDIYSLGVVAYQALTGHVPFDGEDSFSIGYKHIMEELPTPALDTAEQRDLFTVIQKMMAKKPEDRFQTAEELIAALEGGVTATGSVASVSDMASLPTRAFEGVKTTPPAPAIAAQATAPLPRASASMGKPAEAGAGVGAGAAGPPPGKKVTARPPRPAKSKAPTYVAAGLGVVLLGLGGAYFGVIKPGADRAARARADSVAQAESTRIRLARAESLRTDSADTSAAGTSRTPVEPGASRTPTDPGTSRTPTDPGTSRTPPGTSRTPPGTSRTPPVVTPTGPDGTLRLEGTIPPGALIKADNRTIPSSGAKLPPGRYQLLVTAQGFEPFRSTVTINSNQVQRVTVVMLPARVAGRDTPTTRPPAGGADCGLSAVSLRNTNNGCWDTRPTPRSNAIIDVPATCTGRTTAANILVRVDASGNVVGTPTAFQRSNCRDFDAAAVAQAMDVAFNAARKGGTTVEAWVLLRVAPRTQ